MAAGRSCAGTVAARRLLLLTVIVQSWCARDVLATTRPQDVTALNTLATALSATARLNWYGDPCDNLWTGVSCRNSTGVTTVVELNLQNQNLVGNLPSAIGDLSNLQVLEMSRNENLTGPLPAELGNLTQLRYLTLQWCSFTGPIPEELGNLRNLTFFALNGNRLDGTIPPSLGQLERLDWLDISNNTLTGTLPVSSSAGSNGIGLDNLTTVRHFHFNDNRFYGSIPPEIFSLPSILHVIFDHNNFSSTIPTEIAKARTLTIVRFDNNYFTGAIPQEMGDAGLTNVENLNLQNNRLSGTLPDLSNLTALQLLDVSGNQFSAQDFPSWLSSMSTLLTINMAQSNITGQIPTQVFGLPQIQTLNVSRNLMNGTVEFLGNTSTSLQVIDATNNSIIGIAGEPASRGSSQPNLTILLDGNPVCGNPFLAFPTDMTCGTTSMTEFWSVSVNSSCSNAGCGTRILNPKTCNCGRPLELTMILTGMTFSKLTDAIANHVETEIADSSTESTGVTLSVQQVVINSGYLRPDTRYDLDVHFFAATGYSLSKDDKSKLTNALNQRRVHLEEGPYQVPSLADEYVERKSKHGFSGGAIAGMVLGICALVLLASVYAIMQKRRADKAKRSHPFASWGEGGSQFGKAPMLMGARWIHLAELKSATNNWSAQNQIGEGKYGRVYKAVLTAGDTVALKRARKESLRSADVFKVEIEQMSRVHHRNLVGLVGFYYESGEQDLIFEYMSNGTLREHLLGGPHTPLSWQQRLDIALGSARGLAYLHDNANPPIVHANFKSANVLLNNKLVPKVADFGMSRLVSDDRKMETSSYLDPQCHSADQFTYKSDVYSFGVVLLELLSAKVPVASDNSIVDDFRSKVVNNDPKALQNLVDPSIVHVEESQLEFFLRIAFACLAESDADRPGMSTVVKELESMGAQSYSISSRTELDLETSGRKTMGKTLDILREAEESPQSGAFQYSGSDMRSTVFRRSFRDVAALLPRTRGRSTAPSPPFSPFRQTSL